MKKMVILMSGIALLLLLSAATESMILPRFNTRPSGGTINFAELSGPIYSSVYRVSCNVLGESGRCLVFHMELLQSGSEGDRLSIQVDFYLYFKLTGSGKTITKRLTLNPT